MHSKCCVLAIDTSLSVSVNWLYWSNVQELFENQSKKYAQIKIIKWSSKCREISEGELACYVAYIRDVEAGGTHPELIWEYINTFGNFEYDLCLVTDGRIGDTRPFITAYRNLNCKPVEIHVHFCGTLRSLSLHCLDCFDSATYTIKGKDDDGSVIIRTSKKSKPNELYQKLCDFDEFKTLKNGTDQIKTTLEELYIALYREIIVYSDEELSGPIGGEFKVFVDLVKRIVHRVYMKNIDENFEQLFKNYESNANEIYERFVDKFTSAKMIDYREVLDQIVDLGYGRATPDRQLAVYGKTWYERTKNVMEKIHVKDDEKNEYDMEMELDSIDNEQFRSTCPILLLDSLEYEKFCVFWIGEGDTFGSNEYCTPLLGHSNGLDDLPRKISKNSMLLFEYLPVNRLNQRLPPANQYISIEAFIGSQNASLQDIGNKRFDRVYRSPLHQVNCFSLILYDADTPSTGEMTENEKNVIRHNSTTIAQLLFGTANFSGSFSLLHTFFLHQLHSCTILDPYIKKCIEMTIRRSAAILKCPFMICSGQEPNLRSTIKNAIIFHTAIYPNQTKPKKCSGFESTNIIRECIQYCSPFLQLAQNLYGIQYSEMYKKELSFWRFWNYMCTFENIPNNRKLMHFKLIAITKIQNWKNVGNDRIMLVEGSSTKPYLEYLQNIEFLEIVKLIVLFEQSEVHRLSDNLSIDNIKLETSGQWYNVKRIDKIRARPCNMEEIAFCSETCNYPEICPFTQLPRKECYEKQKFQFSIYGYPDSCAHSYVQKCRDLIILRSKDKPEMQIPDVSSLKGYIVKRYPFAVYHADIDTELQIIINKFIQWRKANENVDWKVVLRQ